MKYLSSKTTKIAFLIAVCVTLLIFPFAASAMERDHDHDGGFHGRTYHIYPSYGMDWGWGWDGGWGGPFWDGYWPDYYQNTGTLKLENTSKADEVYINGSLMGEAGKFKSMHLNPGTYQVTLKNSGKDILSQKVFIILGKTTKLEVGDKHGTIKIKDAAKTDSVYINGLDRGEAKDVKDIDLRPGTYKVAVMNHGREVFDQQVTLPMGKTLTLRVGDRA